MRIKNGPTDLVFFLFADHLGSTNVTSDPSGQVVGLSLYMPWGESRAGGAGTRLTDYGFTGQRKNSDSVGLIYYGPRFYDPALGRWAQPDTIVPLKSQGITAWDRYAYVNDSPTRYNDPNGHCPDPDECPDGQQTQPPYNPSPTPVYPTPPINPDPLPTSTPSTNYQPGPTPTFVPPDKVPTTIFPPLPKLVFTNKNVNVADALLDGGQLLTGAGYLATAALGAEPFAAGLFGANLALGGVSMAKAGYEAVAKSDPNDLAKGLTVKNIELIAEKGLALDGEKEIPIIGIIVNAVDLYNNLQPRFVPQ